MDKKKYSDFRDHMHPIERFSSHTPVGFGGAPASKQVDTARQLLEHAHSEIFDSFKKAEREGAIKIDPAQSAAFYDGLRKQVVGEERDWNDLLRTAESKGAHGANFLAVEVLQRFRDVTKMINFYLEIEVSQKAIVIDPARATRFMVELSAITSKSFGGGRGL